MNPRIFSLIVAKASLLGLAKFPASPARCRALSADFNGFDAAVCSAYAIFRHSGANGTKGGYFVRVTTNQRNTNTSAMAPAHMPRNFPRSSSLSSSRILALLWLR
jgi:hypothetical protein